jgi:purine-binding chemotaxis protein CheW
VNNTNAILRERALKAAKRVESTENEHVREVVSFRLGNELYCIEAEAISEVCPFSQPTPLPHVPWYILGIVHMRGRFVSIVNLKSFLGIGNDDLSRTVLLLSDGEMEFGVSVDEVVDELRISEKSIRMIPSGFNLPRSDFILGVNEAGLIVLSGKKLLSDPDMRVHQEVVTTYKGRENVQ